MGSGQRVGIELGLKDQSIAFKPFVETRVLGQGDIERKQFEEAGDGGGKCRFYKCQDKNWKLREKGWVFSRTPVTSRAHKHWLSCLGLLCSPHHVLQDPVVPSSPIYNLPPLRIYIFPNIHIIYHICASSMYLLFSRNRCSRIAACPSVLTLWASKYCSLILY